MASVEEAAGARSLGAWRRAHRSLDTWWTRCDFALVGEAEPRSTRCVSGSAASGVPG